MDTMAEIEALQRELAVIVRVLEEAGIQFNRDYEGHIVGVVMDATATVTGDAEVGV